mmetsp:Transcript_47203/g.124647  ORF Transcript_47203/g.124647 Transcript_47203/m.124647 type:complete len:463 (-) Transcript_47203:116-1504(-)
MKLMQSGAVVALAAGMCQQAYAASLWTESLVDSDQVSSVHQHRYVRGLVHQHFADEYDKGVLVEPISINTTADHARSAWSSASPEEKDEVKKADQWTTSDPDSTDYNEETYVGGWPFSIESTCATILCMLIASAPIVLAAVAEEKLTRTHMLECCALIAWLGGVLYLFTAVLKFQSSHWTGYRPLTIVEAVYLLSQILTTVGYGDITPAFPRGQVWVGFNVIIGLMLYGSIVMEVVEIVSIRIGKYIAKQDADAAAADVNRGQYRLKDWDSAIKIDYKSMRESAVFFLTMASIGIFFFHFKAGEDRTWLQATYMSVITMSTVGFGAFTPLTAFGMVFAALWMLVGVLALGALITNYVDLMMRMKLVQHLNMAEELEAFGDLVSKCCAGAAGKAARVEEPAAMDKMAFLKFAMMYKHDMKEEDLQKIEARWQALGPDPATGIISLDRIDQAERPPLNLDHHLF